MTNNDSKDIKFDAIQRDIFRPYSSIDLKTGRITHVTREGSWTTEPLDLVEDDEDD